MVIQTTFDYKLFMQLSRYLVIDVKIKKEMGIPSLYFSFALSCFTMKLSTTLDKSTCYVSLRI